MNTGEDIQGLRKTIDFTRLISGAILIIHFYLCCYQAFKLWGLTANITDRLVQNIARTGLFAGMLPAKFSTLLFLGISLLGVKGKKDEAIQPKPLIYYIIGGLLLYFGSALVFYFGASTTAIASAYIALTVAGYLLVLTGGGRLSRLLWLKLNKDVFNLENETFPQEERLLENEYSVNLPTMYNLKNRRRKGFINLISPQRGVLIAGTPGAGKSYFIIRHIIDQHLKKGFCMFLYDYKFDDLSKIVYNLLLKYQGSYKVKPQFCLLNPDDPEYSHQCNPLDPQSMEDITDAGEASRTILLGLNKEWIRKQGDFFVESAINFLTAVIWFLRKYENGRYCTLPHTIEMMQADYDPLFAVLQQEPQISAFIQPFISAFQRKAMPQLEGQTASAKIGLARLSSPQLYYLLSGNDFTLDLNNPTAPKIVCAGSNPQKQQVFGAVLSLYVNRMIKLVNRKGQLKSSLIFDEFPTIFLNNMDGLIATARSNKVCTTLAVQDFSQLKKDYGAEQADVITGICGNVISGQVTGDTAKKLSETFGKIMQDRESQNINSSDTSLTKSTQMDYAIPASKIASLSSGEFVGIVSDMPDQRIKLKMFHGEIQNDHEAIAAEEAAYKPIPQIRKVSYGEIVENYMRIKEDVADLFRKELKKLDDAKPKESLSESKPKEENDDSEEQQVISL